VFRLIVIQKQQRRHIMQLNRPAELTDGLQTVSGDVDMEREMQIIHSHFFEHYETLCLWRNALDDEHTNPSNLQQEDGTRNLLGLPLEKMFLGEPDLEEQKMCLAQFRETLVTTISAIEQIQAAHQSAKNLSYQMKVGINKRILL